MPSQSWGPSVSTSSAPQLTISYDSITTDTSGNGRLVNPRATFTYKSGWTDTTNNFSVGGSAVGSANFGAQSLSGGATKTFNLTPVNVALNYSSTTSANIVFTIANVSFFTGDAKTINYTMNIQFPVRPTVVGSITSAPTFNIGGTQSIAFTNPSSTRAVVRYTFGGLSGQIADTTGTSASWNTSSIKTSMLAKIPTSMSGVGTIFVDYYQSAGSSTHVGTASRSFTANAVASDVAVSAGTMRLQEGDATVRGITGVTYASSYSTFLSGLSKISAEGTGHSAGYGSTLDRIEFNIDGIVYKATGTGTVTVTSSLINRTSNFNVTKTVYDKRGNSASVSALATMINYDPPASSSPVVAVRAPDPSNGSQIKVTWKARATSVVIGTQKNSLQVKVSVAPGGTAPTASTGWTLVHTSAASTTVSGDLITNNATFTTPANYPNTNTYDVKLELIDKMPGAIPRDMAYISTEIVPFSIGSVGVGAGKIWERGSIDAGGDIYTGGAVFANSGFYSSSTNIPSGADLDNYVDTATYTVGANAYAQAGFNYPEPLAGFLEVSSSLTRSWVYQRYTTYTTYKTYIRRRVSGTWYEWRLLSEPIVEKAFGVMYKTNGFQASTATESPVTLDYAGAILRGGVTTVSNDGGSFVIPKTALYRVITRTYVSGNGVGSYTFTPWRLVGSTWYQLGATRLEHLRGANDDATSSTVYASLNAGDKISLWFVGQGASTWGDSSKKGAALTIEEV